MSRVRGHGSRTIGDPPTPGVHWSWRDASHPDAPGPSHAHRSLAEEQVLALLGHRRLRRERLPFCVGATYSRTRFDAVEPATQIHEIIQVLLLSPPRDNPGTYCHVRNRVGVP